MARSSAIVIGIAVVVWGCTTAPADYAATLSRQDPKWLSPGCREIRSQALNHKERNLNWASGLLIGPYGLALVAAGKEHQEKQRMLFARELHMRCSSLPLPKELQTDPAISRTEAVPERGEVVPLLAVA